ncbi:hypothetical protein KGY72_09225 [Candidatus Bipolaricaulota bacterium]|nr:hypothetical protein [Candidatus Bipolaricaulota bacterium]
MKVPKTVLVLLIGALLVTSVGFVFLATRPEGEKTVFSTDSGPVSRARVSNQVKEGKVVPTVLLNRDKARRLLGEGEKAFVSSGKSGQPVLILCPGHRDFIKSTVALLSNHQGWIEVE